MTCTSADGRHYHCSPEDCSLLQQALGRKYSSQHRAIAVELEEGNVALFNGAGELVAIGPWEALGSAFAARPRPTTPAPRLRPHAPEIEELAALLGL